METNNTSTNEVLTTVINDLKRENADMKKIINILMQNKNEEKNDKNDTYVVIKENQAEHVMNQKMDILIQRLDGKQVIKNTVNEDNNQQKKEDVIKSTKKKTKKEKYQRERIDFIDKLEKIIGLSETKRDILLYDLENNNELKKYLKNKISDIQKFYKCGSWNYFIKLNSKSEVSEIALLKSIFKSEKYELFNKRILKDINGVKKMYPIYTFYKKY
jgi:hypothetical protein